MLRFSSGFAWKTTCLARLLPVVSMCILHTQSEEDVQEFRSTIINTTHPLCLTHSPDVDNQLSGQLRPSFYAQIDNVITLITELKKTYVIKTGLSIIFKINIFGKSLDKYRLISVSMIEV